MIWYRHWLEMRVGLIFLGVLWALWGFTLAGPFQSLGWTSWQAWPWEPFDVDLAQLPLAAAVGADAFSVWTAFAGRILPFAFAVALVLAGTGVDSLVSPSGAASAYTLTLPISRTRLVCTRLVAALVVSISAGALLIGVCLALLVARGVHVPMGPVVQSLALAVPWVAALVAVAGAMVATLRAGWAFFAVAALGVTTTVPVSYTAAAPARFDTPWGVVVACLGITALALAYTVVLTARREY